MLRALLWAILALGVALQPAAAAPVTVRDAFGRSVTVPAPPQRIVAIFASNVEMLAALGLADRIVGIEEKPSKPKSNYAVTGIYMYDPSVFDKIKTLVPSGRGELEITDVNNAYIKEGNMTFSYLDGWWTDAGTFESLLRAANLVAQSAAVPVASPADVAKAVSGAVRI